MSNQVYANGNDPYWLSSRGVPSVSFIKQPSQPLAYLDSGILYELDDGNLYYNGSQLNGGPSGDISGPGSSTDNAVMRWDGVTGTVAANSSVIVSDAGGVSAQSVTLAPVGVNPGGGDTLWINSGSGHVMCGAEDLEVAKLLGGVDISAAGVPSIGQTLVATSGTTAVWGDGSSTVFEDDQFEIVDAVDATKKLQFDVDGSTGVDTTIRSLSTANRVVTLPDATDTLVGRDTVDTLTNKTIISTTNNVAANSLKTTGAVVSVAAAAPPTTGQALTATSATTATWQNRPGSICSNVQFFNVGTPWVSAAIATGAAAILNPTTTLTAVAGSGTFTSPSNVGRLTYVGASAAVITLTACICIKSSASGSSQFMRVAIQKNTGAITPMAVLNTFSSSTSYTVTLTKTYSAVTNDYFQISLYNETAGSAIFTVTSMYLEAVV